MSEKKFLELTDEDSEQIEIMQNFYDIPYDVALERYLSGNYDGHELTPEDMEFLS